MANNPLDDFDLEKLKQEQADAEAQKTSILKQGGIADNLSNRQSFGNFFLGHMNPQIDSMGYARTMAAQVQDPVEQKKKLLADYQALKTAKKADADEVLSAAHRDPMSPESQRMRETLKGFGVPVSDKLSAADMKDYLPIMTKKLDVDGDVRKAKLLADAKANLVPKGYQMITDPETGEQKLAKLDTAKPSQYQAATYGQRLAQAEDAFRKLSEDGYDPTSKTAAIQRLPKFPELMKSDEAKRQEQAERNFVNAQLRRESGSAIAPSEFASAERQYFPRVGDSPELLAEKAKNRQLVMAGLKAEAGDAWNQVAKQFAGLPAGAVPHKDGSKKSGDSIDSATADASETREVNGVIYRKTKGGWKRL